MQDELLDVIDEQNNVTGTENKSIIHEKGLPHRVSAILVKKPNGDYLIPTASALKVEAGGLFHSAAGHVISGQSYVESAVRELREETGLHTNPEDFHLFGSFWLMKVYPTRKEKERFEVFTVTYRPEMGTVVFNSEQTNEQWLNEATLRKIYTYEPYRLSYPLQLSCINLFKF